MIKKKVLETLKKNREKLATLGVRHIAIFGSVARDEERPDSDVDLLVDFDSKKGLFIFIRLKQFLEKILGREVDLATKNSLHPLLKKQILSEVEYAY